MSDGEIDAGVLFIPDELTWKGAANTVEASLEKAMKDWRPVIMSIDPAHMGGITMRTIYTHEGPRWQVGPA